jgi:hypothetical protein
MMNEDSKAKPRIQSKVLASLLTVVSLMAVAGVVIAVQQHRMRDVFTMLDGVQEVERLLLECRRQEKNFFLRLDRSSVELFAAHSTALLDHAAMLREEALDPGLLSRQIRLERTVGEYRDAFADAERGWLADISIEERDLLMETTVTRARVSHQLVADIRSVALARSRAASAVTEAITFIAGGVGVIASIILASLLARHIAKPFEVLRMVAERVSTGDIQDMDVGFGDIEVSSFNTKESLDLALALKRMLTSLRLLVPTERGLMSSYHLAILVLVQRAVGPAAWAVIEKARAEAGFKSFSDVEPASINAFAESLAHHLGPFISSAACVQLCAAVRQLRE